MNKDNLLFCCEMIDKSETADTASELLAAYGYDFSAYHDFETDEVKYILYFNNLKSAKAAVVRLSDIPHEWRATGISFSALRTFSLEKKDWTEVWKKYFTIQHISENMTIKPTWLDYVPKSDREIVIEIDPGMSFGTGRHATTRFCLKMIEEIQDNKRESFLDAGCGSGILSIAAVKSGFKTVTAFDIDPVCITCTRDNFEMNHLKPDEINLLSSDIADFAKMSTSATFPAKYDVVTANILSHILYENREKIISFINPGGYLILAGIATKEYQRICDAFTGNGLVEKLNISEDEWTGGVFELQL